MVSAPHQAMWDLTQQLNEQTPHFPGDTAFHRAPMPGPGPWRISNISMSSHNGTHLDAPLHRIAGGASIEQLPLSRLTGHGLLVDATGLPDNSPVPETVLETLQTPTWPGWFALIHTGWDRYWQDARYFRHPYLSPGLAKHLVDAGCGLVAIDALSVDSTADNGDRAHAILLGNDILIAENLYGLHDLEPGRRYCVACLPLPMTGADGSPVRFIAWLPGEI